MVRTVTVEGVCQLHVNKERLHRQIYFTQKGSLGGGTKPGYFY